MQYKNESQILNLIKYVPSLFIVIILIIITIFLYIEKTNSFNTEKNNLEKEYRENRKQQVQQRVQSSYDYTSRIINETEKELKISLKEEVDKAYKIVDYIYYQNLDKPESEVINMIKNALRTIRFNENRGYFFIYSLEGKNILNSGFPAIEGKDFWKYQDLKGTFLLQEMNKILNKKDETFYDWYWYKPKDIEKKQYKKVGFFKKFEPLNWFIGTGEYQIDFKKALEQKILKHISNIRFENTNYIFVLDYSGKFLSHINPKYTGKYIFDFENDNNVKTGEEIISIAKKGEGFIKYLGLYNQHRKSVEFKTAYIKGLQDLQWAIGTGFYEDELRDLVEVRKNEYDKRYYEYITNMLIIFCLFTIFLLFLSRYLSTLLEKKFKNYQEEIKKHIEEKERQHKILSQQSKMAAMGEMIANIAHQWRQPLSTITTAATSMKLEKELNGLTDEYFEHSIKGITNSANFLSKTIDDFRNFFNPNKIKISSDISKIFKKSVKLISSELKMKDVKIVCNINDIELLTYENEFIQVIINILNNSIHEFQKKSNANLSKIILFDSFEKDNSIVITIQDNAGGIPSEILPRIFEPYFTTKHKSQGTGIGLYMSREIIVKHLHGSIEASNRSFIYKDIECYGALFKITLKKEK